MLGTIGDDGVALREVHRFTNRPIRTPDGLHWNILGLYAEVLSGLERALAADDEIVSLGVDSWGVDYGLFDAAGRLLQNPYHYRDGRTDGMRETYRAHVSAAEQYARTGIAQLSINTLYQLAAHADSDRIFELADALLMIPDIMHFWLTGQRSNELTNASTTGALGVDGRWAHELLSPIGVPQRIFGEPLVEAAGILGMTRDGLDLGPRARALRVVVPPTHDTACAVLAAPLRRLADDTICAYISSGTWSLLGVEVARPILSEAARLAGFTNERGIAGSVRFLRNIMGLWLVQECRRAWQRANEHFTYEELTARAATSASPGLVIDVDDPALLHPADMPAALREQLVRSGQRAETDPVGLTRAIFEGLALQYRRSIADAERLAGVRVGAIAIVGGGSRNAVLCQLAADACERIVFAGPAEASATGNILVQAVADRAVSGLAQIRAFVESTAHPQTFEPRRSAGIDWAARAAALDDLRAGRPLHALH